MASRNGAGIEHRLLRAAQRGDVGARSRVIARHLRLVRGVASRYRDLGLQDDDLVQEGSVGLLEAIGKYDRSRGVPFEAFARFHVRRAIRNALTARARLIRLPKHVVGRGDDDVAVVVPAASDELAGADPLSPDPEWSLLTKEERRIVNAAVRHLPPRQQAVVCRHFGIGCPARTLERVASELHVSVGRVRELERAALTELRLEIAPWHDPA